MNVAWSNWRQLVWPKVPGFEIEPPHSVPADAPSRPTVLDSDALTEDESRQIISALAARDDSGAKTVTELLERAKEIFRGASDIAEYVLGASIEWWDLAERDGARRWRVWLYGIDCGRTGSDEKAVTSGLVPLTRSSKLELDATPT